LNNADFPTFGRPTMAMRFGMKENVLEGRAH
jgi:hypothetical protein